MSQFAMVLRPKMQRRGVTRIACYKLSGLGACSGSMARGKCCGPEYSISFRMKSTLLPEQAILGA